MFHCFKKAHQTLQNTVFSLTFDVWLLEKSRPNTAKYSVLSSCCIIKVQGTAPKHWKRPCFLQLLRTCCFKKAQQTLQNIVFYASSCITKSWAASESHWPPPTSLSVRAPGLGTRRWRVKPNQWSLRGALLAQATKSFSWSFKSLNRRHVFHPT